jgi:hypothetical protein
LAASIGNFCVALTASNNQNDQRNAGDVRFGAAAAPAAIIGTERGKKEEGRRERKKMDMQGREGMEESIFGVLRGEDRRESALGEMP